MEAAAIEGVQILVPVVTTVSAINQGTTGNIVKEASGSKPKTEAEKERDEHNWNKLVPNPKDPKNWGAIAAIIDQVISKGKEEPYKSVTKKVLEVGGKTVEVVYKVINGEIKISDA